MCAQEQMEKKKEYYQGVNNTYEIKYVNNSVLFLMLLTLLKV